jgi:hypothetical protein
MYGNTGNLFLLFNDRLVYMMPVHAFAAEFRQQGRVDIDNAIRKTVDEVRRDQPKKPGQYDPVDVMVQQVVEYLAGIIKLISVKNQNRQIMLFSPFYNESIRTVGADAGNPDPRLVLKVDNNVFSVCA